MPRSLRRLTAVAILVALTVGFSYVLEVNTIVDQGYRINSLERAIKDFTLNNQQLKVQVSVESSFANLSDVMSALNLVSADDVSYIAIQPGPPVLAQETRALF